MSHAHDEELKLENTTSNEVAIQVKNQVGVLTFFTIKKSMYLGETFKVYAKQEGQQREKLRFLINDVTLSDIDTLQLLNLKENDRIDCCKLTYSEITSSAPLALTLEQITSVLSELTHMFIYEGELSLDIVREKINLLPSAAMHFAYEHNMPIFHCACGNMSVSLEIIECVLTAFPSAVYCQYGGSEAFPLHVACYNYNCPSEVITLLVKKNPDALCHFSLVGDGVNIESYEYDGYIKGLPLHYYLARKSNMDIDTVKMLVKTRPQALLSTEDEMDFTPVHALLSNPNVKNLQDILTYILESEPSVIRLLDADDATLLYMACMNRRVNLSLFEIVYYAYPEAAWVSNIRGRLPIHILCCNYKLGKTASLDILQSMLNIDPTLLRERGGNSYLPIHHAVQTKSAEFCKKMLDAYPESAMARTGNGSLPIHKACRYGTRSDSVNTIQYLLELYPNSIHARDNDGWLPIHKSASPRKKDRSGRGKDIVALLLKHDHTVASTATENNCRLPLHIACNTAHSEHLGIVQLLFDAYPEAIWTRDVDGETPLDIAKRAAQSRNPSNIVSFVEAQMMIAPANVQSIHLWSKFYTRTQNGGTGSLPLHRALNNNATLGAIKLLVKGNPESLQVANNQGSLPLHIACEFSSVKVVQFLLELNGNDSCLDHLDIEGNSPLHYACRGGSYNTVKYLLERNASSVSERNADGKLPIHLLCEAEIDEVGEESTQYVEAIWLLLLANPTGVMT